MGEDRIFGHSKREYSVKKKIELWDLYNKNIYIKIKRRTINQFFDYFIKHLKDKQKLIIRNIWHYKNGIYFSPLDLIIKILNSLSKKNQVKFKKKLEKDLEELRFGYGLGKSIKNPKLPIKFSPKLARICGHLIGDGGIRLIRGDHAAHYTNKNNILINQFKEDVQKTFGNIDSYEYSYNTENKNKDLKKIRFPSIIGVLLMEFFGPQIKDLKDIPDIILESDKKCKSLFLQALFDDEGCISSNRIIIAMSNKKVIEKIKKMLELEFFIYPTTTISKKKNEKYYLSYRLEIHGRKDIISFSKKIGFSHPIKKKNLKIYIEDYKNKQAKFRKGELKNLIIDILKKEDNLNVYNIASRLNIPVKRSFRKQLYSLETRKVIKAIINKNKIKIYSLK